MSHVRWSGSVSHSPRGCARVLGVSRQIAFRKVVQCFIFDGFVWWGQSDLAPVDLVLQLVASPVMWVPAALVMSDIVSTWRCTLHLLFIYRNKSEEIAVVVICFWGCGTCRGTIVQRCKWLYW